MEVAEDRWEWVRVFLGVVFDILEEARRLEGSSENLKSPMRSVMLGTVEPGVALGLSLVEKEDTGVATPSVADVVIEMEGVLARSMESLGAGRVASSPDSLSIEGIGTSGSKSKDPGSPADVEGVLGEQGVNCFEALRSLPFWKD